MTEDEGVEERTGDEIKQEEMKKEAKPIEEQQSSEVNARIASEEDLLLPQDTLLSAGIHIGTRMKTGDMEQFIYRVRPDGLFVLDVKRTDERIKYAAKFLGRFEPSKIAVVAARLYGQEPVTKFCEITGATPVAGRFIPGLLSNPLYPKRIEPDVIIISDPRADSQAVREASSVGIPVVALCSTDNEFIDIDLVIPTNNKGRRALAVIYWLLARQILRERGEISSDKDLPLTVDDFEAKVSRTDA